MTTFQSFVKDVDDYRIRLKKEGATVTGVDQLNIADVEAEDEEDVQGRTLLVRPRLAPSIQPMDRALRQSDYRTTHSSLSGSRRNACRIRHRPP
jgi:hypothetical protein